MLKNLMDKKIIIGVGLATIGISALAYLHWKPRHDRKRLIQLFIEKNYTNISEQLTADEKRKLEDVIFNLSEKEQKTLLSAYKSANVENMDELRRILDKLHPVMDEIKPAFDITRIELGKKQIYLHIKNALQPNIIFSYGIAQPQPITMKIPLVDATKDGKALMTLIFNKGKLSAFEADKKIQEEEIIEKPIITNKQQIKNRA